MKSSWKPKTGTIPQEKILHLVLFHIFSDDLDDGPVCTLRKFADDTDLGGVVDAESGAAIQRDHNRLENCCKKPHEIIGG